jgi:molecular chaperone DnaK
VEIHVVQGEREMAVDNKSLGRFKLYGIPPAPRGIPQIQVAFDIDANGILQVTALDRTTGREQSITIQGASTLSESEVQQAIREAEKFADIDRQRKEKVEKRTRAEALILQSERQLRGVALDFGMAFARNRRQQIDNICRELRESLKENDDRGIDQAYADLQDALYDLNREVRQYYAEEEDDDLLGAIKDIFTGGGDKERDNPRDTFRDRDYYDRDYDRGYGKDYDRSPSRDYNINPSRDYDRGYSNRDYDRDRSYGRDSRDSRSSPFDSGSSRRSRPSYQDNWDDDDDW